MEFKRIQCSINEREFTLFRDYIAEKSGIVIPPEKAYLIETRLSKLMLDAEADSFGAFYQYIIARSDSGMTEKILDAITINETMWFRDATSWKVMEEVILPPLVADLAAGRKNRARIWCAAVSTGQEVYSAVMCVDNYLKTKKIAGVTLSQFDFFATDISGRVIAIAKNGRYDKISIMRGLGDDYRQKYFTQNGSVWEIEPDIKKAVRFERFNLQNSYRNFGLFDVIFCRYVLIYFSDELKKDIVRRLRDALTDGGVLFTGNYVLYDLFRDDFFVEHYDNLTYYAKRGG